MNGVRIRRRTGVPAGARHAPGRSNVPRAPMAPAPPPSRDTVELTCTRAVCHVVYTVSIDLLPLLRGCTCPKCRRGVLEIRTQVVP